MFLRLQSQQRTWRIGVLSLVLMGCCLVYSAHAQPELSHPTVLYFFWGDGCPHCASEKAFLAEAQVRFPELEIRDFELYFQPENRPLYTAMAEAFGIEASGVPATFIADKAWIGFSLSTRDAIEQQLYNCRLPAVCEDAGTRLSGEARDLLERHYPLQVTSNLPLTATNGVDATHNELRLPLIGTVQLKTQPLVMTTFLIALVDGFNPCSLWVLSLLLAMVIGSGSRSRMFAVGLTFLLTTSIIYVLFIAGLFQLVSVLSFVRPLQVVVALLVLIFAAINIKDYFYFQQGLSLTIDDRHKPGIYKHIRRILKQDRLVPMMIATTVMAAGVTLVELPCTVGFPMIWTSLVAQQDVGMTTFIGLLGLYLLVFLLDELFIFTTAVVSLRVERLQEKQGRLLKLFGGVLMLSLGIVMLVRPSLMTNFIAALSVFLIAGLLALLVLLTHRNLLPRFGLHIGSEF